MHVNQIILVILVILIMMIIVSTTIKMLGHLKSLPREADIVIVGGGTASCVLARRLHDKYPGKTIVVLQRGKDYRNDPNVYNVAKGLTAAYSEPYSESITSDFPRVACVVSKCLAGGSSVNFGLCVKGSTNYWDRMRQQLDITKDDLEVVFRRVQDTMRITPLPVTVDLPSRIIPFASMVLTEGTQIIQQAWNVLRNTGPLRANDFLSDAMLKSIGKLKGVKEVVDYNDPNAGEVSMCRSPYLYLDKTLGVRWSVAKGYLSEGYMKISAGDNLKIIEDATVDTVDEDYVYVDGGRKIHAKEKIIMSAGGIYTPFILQKSGYTSGGQVGLNLTNHYGTSIVMAIRGDSRQVADFSSGPVIFMPEGNALARDWQMVISGSVLTNLDFLREQGVDVDRYQKEGYNFITCLLWILNPKTRGSVTSEGVKPTIELRLFEHPDDSASIVEGLRFMSRFASEFDYNLGDDVDLEVVFPPQDVLNRNQDTEMLEYAKIGVSNTDHYHSTVPMGKLVDPANFKLNGSDKIHVVDASVIPIISNGNTEYPVLVFAEIAADRL